VRIRAARLHPYRLGLRAPLVTAHERLEARAGLLLELIAGDGTAGWGDACPIRGFGMETLERCGEALADLAAATIGHELPGDAAALRACTEACAADAPGALGALETALTDLSARVAGVSLAEKLGGAPGRRALEISELVVGDAPAQVEASARAAVARGFGTLKLKVAARDWRDDLARLRALREAVPPPTRVRLDANGGWTEAAARERLADLASLDVELIEQPVVASQVDALARLRELGAVPIAADEAVASAADVSRVVGSGAADVVVLKPAVLGGPRVAVQAARAALEAGCGVVVTSLIDSAIGVTAAAHVAAALPSGRPADGLATGGLLDADVASGPVVAAGCMRLPDGPGLGLVPEPALLERLRRAPLREIAR